MSVVTGGGGGLEQCFAVIILEYYPKKTETRIVNCPDIFNFKTKLLISTTAKYSIKNDDTGKCIFLFVFFYHCVLFTTCSSMIQWTKSAVWNQEEEGGKEERPILAETPPISCGIHGYRRRRHNGRNAVYKKRRIGGRGSPARMRVVGVWDVQDEVKQKNPKKKKKKKNRRHIQFYFYFSPTVQNLRWIFFVIDSLELGRKSQESWEEE